MHSNTTLIQSDLHIYRRSKHGRHVTTARAALCPVAPSLKLTAASFLVTLEADSEKEKEITIKEHD